MSKSIGNFQALGTYDHATETITITSDINGWSDLTTAATAAEGGDPEGIDFDIKVVYENADYDTSLLEDFEEGTWSYSLDGSDETLIRQTTNASTTGGSINFNSDSNKVRVYGVVSATKLNDYGLRLDELDTGWSIPTFTGTWTYASASTFTVAGVDVTSSFPKGAKIRLTNSTLKYFYVVDSSFSTDTTITVSGGTDYTLANTTISDPYISYADSPIGFPQWFNYTPTFSNVTLGNGGHRASLK